MPTPTTGDEFLEVARKCGVLERASLDAYIARLQTEATLPTKPTPSAKAMIRDGLLTRFQADLLLQGKWRGFVINNKYILLERLGAGAMGRVYLCQHKIMRRRVAIKVLPSHLVDEPGCLERF